MQPIIPDGFSEKDPIHTKVLEALKVITGRTFELAQADTEDGKKIWVYRTIAQRPAFENSELLDWSRGKPADSPDIEFGTYIKKPKETSEWYGAVLFTNVLHRMGILEHYDVLNTTGVSVNLFNTENTNVDHIIASNGDTHGTLDFSAQTVGERKALDVESLLKLAASLSKTPNYELPNISFIDKPITDEERASVDALYIRWAECMKNLAAGGGRAYYMSEALEAAHLIDGSGESPDARGHPQRPPVLPRNPVQPRPAIKPKGDKEDEGREPAKGGLDI